MVSGWSAGSSTATVYALDASTFGLLWNSSALGGSSAPTAVAVGAGRTFVMNSDGTVRAFKSAGCGTSLCDPQWSSTTGSATGVATPPTLANGVVYAAGLALGPPDLAEIEAFDASGASCGGSPVICGPIWYPNYSGKNSQITVVAGTVFGAGSDSLSVAELY